MAAFAFGFLMFLAAFAYCVDAALIPSVPLKNAAQNNTWMPVVGLGTGYYNGTNFTFMVEATQTWLAVGGRRIDTSFSYNDQPQIAQGIAGSFLLREELFITSKVGPSLPLGYNETLQQFQQILASLNTSYVDLLLIHWPGPLNQPPSSDPACQPGTGSPSACRQSTWRAMEVIFNQGEARAIGVSNFEMSHLEDIISMGGLLPAVNQMEFHPYWANLTLLEFCQSYDIQFNGYSPLGAPDISQAHVGWNLLNDPLVNQLASSYMRTPAQIILRWEVQLGLVVNPRSANKQHMLDNLDIFDFELLPSEMLALANLTAPAGSSAPNICPNPNLIP